MPKIGVSCSTDDLDVGSVGLKFVGLPTPLLLSHEGEKVCVRL